MVLSTSNALQLTEAVNNLMWEFLNFSLSEQECVTSWRPLLFIEMMFALASVCSQMERWEQLCAVLLILYLSSLHALHPGYFYFLFFWSSGFYVN